MTIAVTGLNATDNPGPGVGVARALRRAPEFRGRIVGLAYDSLEPGIYAADVVDDVFLIPYPSQGPAAFERRLQEIHAELPLDVVIPNLDAEIPTFIELAPTLQRWGIGTCLPTADLFDLRSKAHLARLGAMTDIQTPATAVIADPKELASIHETIPFPLWIKGAYYGATEAHSPAEAVAAYHAMVAKWGLPVIAQAGVVGDEVDVVAVGDGEGGMVGAVPMRKRLLTDKGKGWAGIAIADPEIDDLSRRYFAATRWRGPCEIEMVRTQDGSLHLLEVNPRFPAWCFLSAGAGMNLPWAVAQLAAGQAVAPMTEYAVGTLFVRISTDQIVPLSQFESIAQTGALHHRPAPAPQEESP